MSVAMMTRVWELSLATEGCLLVLLAIADFADDQGRAWPSVRTLAKKARLSERQTRYVLRKLEQSGELKTQPNSGPHGCHLFQIIIAKEGAKTAGGQLLPGAISDKGGAVCDTLGGQCSAPEPSVKPPKEPSLGRNRAKASSESEIIDYVTSLRLPRSDGESLWLKWQENGWKNGGQPIKDWKMTIQRWKHDGILPSQKRSVIPTPSGNGEHSGEWLDSNRNADHRVWDPDDWVSKEGYEEHCRKHGWTPIYE